jgi:lipoic acid synthetase
MNKHPYWLRKKAFEPAFILDMKALLDNLKLHSVCEGAHCPNQGECFSHGTVTFLILGDVCTRNCNFCAVKKGIPLTLDPEEPKNMSEAVRELNLNYVVITSVTRDDLPDGGASHFAKVVKAIKSTVSSVAVELLVPDFRGSMAALTEIVSSFPDVISHNIETIPRLYPAARPKANYQRSIELLKNVKRMNQDLITKSGIMLGLGEERSEVIQALDDLRNVDCDLVTLGQYLPPSLGHYPLSKYITPEEFQELEKIGLAMGFRGIASGPFVRSSFNAAQLFREANLSLCNSR